MIRNLYSTLIHNTGPCVQRLFRDCTEIVWRDVQSPQIPLGNRTVLVRALYRGRAEMVRRLCEGRTITVRFFFANDRLKSCEFDHHVAPHDAPTTYLRATGLPFFSNWS